MAKMTADEKLGFVKFTYADKHEPHITINETYKNENEIRKLLLVCPAGLYRYEDGKLLFNAEGCLECGACRVVSGGKGVKTWNHPEGGFGVEYRQG